MELFLGGDWADEARELVLCTSDSLRTTQRIEEFERQRARLSERGILLRVWARGEICDRLRRLPLVVHDFFGRAWVERFCGADAAADLGHRLSPEEVGLFRKHLRCLYASVFAAHDPGLAATYGEVPLPLYERYVSPDIVETRDTADTADRSQVPQEHPGDGSGRGNELALDRPTSPLESETAVFNARPAARQRRRVPFEYHFAAAPAARHIILGGPGSGKSALLRFVALDLLSEAPRLSGVARAWGSYLPVWLPFGAWVDRIEHGDRDTPLSAVVRHWLTQWDAGDLFPLVESALRDRRLLLLIDGLDEWTSEDAARIALAQLHVFVSQRDLPVVLTSRPHGFQQLAAEVAGWRIAELAPLSREQQVALAEHWFEHRLSQQVAQPPEDATHYESREAVGDATLLATPQAARLARDAIAEIHRLGDLQVLAEVPLLLSALLLLDAQDAELPADRFRAYAELTRQLMFVQPRRRRAAAQLTGGPAAALRDDEREQAYAYLACCVLQESPSGLVDSATAHRHLEHFLHDDTFGVAYSVPDAAQLARELIYVGQSVSGILVKRSPRELGFYHRALQEHLAAVHLSSLPSSEQVRLLTERAVDPQWREVILALTALTRSQQSVADLVDALRASADTAAPVARLQIRELLTEIAAGPFACPVSTARSLIDEACKVVEEGWWLAHRQKHLALLLGL